MSAPGDELRWGLGFEENKPRKLEIFRPFIREAIDLAVEGIDDLGLSLNERKYVVVDQVPPSFKTFGESRYKTSHILLNSNEVSRQWIDVVLLAGMTLHELVHLIHDENSFDEGMPKYAA